MKYVTNRAFVQIIDGGSGGGIEPPHDARWEPLSPIFYPDSEGFGGGTYSIATYDLVIDAPRSAFTNQVARKVMEDLETEAKNQGIRPLTLLIFRDTTAGERGHTAYRFQFAAAGASPVAVPIFGTISAVVAAGILALLVLLGIAAVVFTFKLGTVRDIVREAGDILLGPPEVDPTTGKPIEHTHQKDKGAIGLGSKFLTVAAIGIGAFVGVKILETYKPGVKA